MYPYTITIPCKNYQTQDIIRNVHTNTNKEWVLRTSILEYENSATSTDLKELSEVLDYHFDNDAIVIMHTHTLSDDDGGECYQAYILKGSHHQFYLDIHQEVMQDDTINQMATFDMQYIINHPSHVMILWAGSC